MGCEINHYYYYLSLQNSTLIETKISCIIRVIYIHIFHTDKLLNVESLLHTNLCPG